MEKLISLPYIFIHVVYLRTSFIGKRTTYHCKLLSMIALQTLSYIIMSASSRASHILGSKMYSLLILKTVNCVTRPWSYDKVGTIDKRKNETNIHNLQSTSESKMYEKKQIDTCEVNILIYRCIGLEDKY